MHLLSIWNFRIKDWNCRYFQTMLYNHSNFPQFQESVAIFHNWKGTGPSYQDLEKPQYCPIWEYFTHAGMSPLPVKFEKCRLLSGVFCLWTGMDFGLVACLVASYNVPQTNWESNSAVVSNHRAHCHQCCLLAVSYLFMICDKINTLSLKKCICICIIFCL